MLKRLLKIWKSWIWPDKRRKLLRLRVIFCTNWIVIRSLVKNVRGNWIRLWVARRFLDINIDSSRRECWERIILCLGLLIGLRFLNIRQGLIRRRKLILVCVILMKNVNCNFCIYNVYFYGYVLNWLFKIFLLF